MFTKICIQAEGKQSPLAIIFQGKGFRICEDEKVRHWCVHVYFQVNAWTYSLFSFNWDNTMLGSFIDNGVERYVFADNLTVQTTDQFKEWFGMG